MLSQFVWYRRFLRHAAKVYGTGRGDYFGPDIVETYYPNTLPEDAADEDAQKYGLEPV